MSPPVQLPRHRTHKPPGPLIEPQAAREAFANRDSSRKLSPLRSAEGTPPKHHHQSVQHSDVLAERRGRRLPPTRTPGKQPSRVTFARGVTDRSGRAGRSPPRVLPAHERGATESRLPHTPAPASPIHASPMGRHGQPTMAAAHGRLVRPRAPGRRPARALSPIPAILVHSDQASWSPWASSSRAGLESVHATAPSCQWPCVPLTVPAGPRSGRLRMQGQHRAEVPASTLASSNRIRARADAGKAPAYPNRLGPAGGGLGGPRPPAAETSGIHRISALGR